VSVSEIIHGVEHLTVAEDEHGNWSVRIDDRGDEAGFVKAMHVYTVFSQFNAAELLQMGHKSCEWLHNGSGPTEIIDWMDQTPPPPPVGVSIVLLHKAELDLIINSQVYLCPDTLHNGTVSTPTPTTTAHPAPTGPTTMVATTAPPYPTPGWTWPPSDMNAYCRDHPNDWVECGGSGPSTPSSTPTYPTPDPCPYPGAAAHGCVAPTHFSPCHGTSHVQAVFLQR
jgi:hypothetical protein